MGTKSPRPDTIDPEMQRMIDRYVNNALAETGTSGTEIAHGRLARASVPPPIVDFMVPPPVDPAALVRELAEAMAEAEIMAMAIAKPDVAVIVAPVPAPSAPPRVLFTPPPREFVDEAPTDLDDDEPTGVFSPPLPR